MTLPLTPLPMKNKSDETIENHTHDETIKNEKTEQKRFFHFLFFICTYAKGDSINKFPPRLGDHFSCRAP